MVQDTDYLNIYRFILAVTVMMLDFKCRKNILEARWDAFIMQTWQAGVQLSGATYGLKHKTQKPLRK